MTIRNIGNLTELRDAIAGEKKRHDQDSWAKVKVKFPKGVERMEVTCYTTACAAGHTCLNAGDRLIIDLHNGDTDNKGTTWYYVDKVRTDDGEEFDVADRAQDLLGLTNAERSALFYDMQSTNETIATLDKLITGEDIVQ